MERITARKHDIVLFQKDGQYTPPISMNGEQVRKVMERLAELEDAIEQGKLVEAVRCGECEHAHEHTIVGKKGLMHCFHHAMTKLPNDFCSCGEHKGKVCASKDCSYQQGNPCEAAEGCGGFEGAEESFLMQRFMKVE